MARTATTVSSIWKNELANMLRKLVISVMDRESRLITVPVSSPSKYRCGSERSLAKYLLDSVARSLAAIVSPR